MNSSAGESFQDRDTHPRYLTSELLRSLFPTRKRSDRDEFARASGETLTAPLTGQVRINWTADRCVCVWVSRRSEDLALIVYPEARRAVQTRYTRATGKETKIKSRYEYFSVEIRCAWVGA